jgi:hypothetical protein
LINKKRILRKEEEKSIHYSLSNIFNHSFSLLSINQLVKNKKRRESKMREEINSEYNI